MFGFLLSNMTDQSKKQLIAKLLRVELTELTKFEDVLRATLDKLKLSRSEAGDQHQGQALSPIVLLGQCKDETQRELVASYVMQTIHESEYRESLYDLLTQLTNLPFKGFHDVCHENPEHFIAHTLIPFVSKMFGFDLETKA